MKNSCKQENILYNLFVKKNLLTHNLNKTLYDDGYSTLLSTGLLPNNLIPIFKNESTFDFDLFKTLYILREQYIKKYGFALLSEPFIDSLAEQLSDSTTIELGAGSGFLSLCLQNKGINITPYDKYPLDKNKYKFSLHHTEVLVNNAASIIEENKCFSYIISWPNYADNWAYKALLKMQKGTILYYCGEGRGGCTANDAFFDFLSKKTSFDPIKSKKINKHYLSWKGIHDRWYVYIIN